VQRFIVILLAALIAAAPAAATLSAGCDCTPAAESSEAAADGCCDAPTNSGDDAPGSNEPQDDRPCDGADCSVLCCTAGKTIGVANDAAGRAPGATAAIFAIPDDAPRGAAHLDRLKRPPRA